MRYKPSDNVTFDFVDSWDKTRIEPTPNEPFLMRTYWEGSTTSESEVRNHTYSGLISANVKPGYDVEQAYALCGYLVNHYNTSGDDWRADFNIFRFIPADPTRLYNTTWNQEFEETTYIVDDVQYEWPDASEYARLPQTGPYGAQIGEYSDTQYNFTIETNFPIFDTLQHAIDYITTGSLVGCLNCGAEYDQDTQDYYIYTSHKHASVKNGSITWATGVATFSFERILAQRGSICLYRSADPNVYRLRANLVVGSYYSSTSKPDVENADPADFAPGVRYSGPFYDVYNKSFGDGSFELALPTRDLYSKSTTNIPIFSDEEKADGYLDGSVPEEEAENYSYIANDFGDARNVTGELEDATQVGTNNSRGVFAVDYCMSRTGLASLGGDFFSESYLEDMKKGLELYGNNPMNSVLQCLYFPFDISSIYSVASVEFVHFGSYNHPVSGYGINKVLFNTGLKDLGTTHILPTFRNFLDYTATEIYAYLPYIGWVNLDVNKYMDTDLNIKYAVDLHSGECTAMLFSNGRLMDCYDGQIGIKQPITSEDMSAYFMAQIQGIKGATGAVTGGAINGAQVGAKGGAYGAAAGAIVGGGLGAVNAGVTLYGLAKMRPQLFSSGGYSGALGANLPQYPIIVFCIHDCEEPVNLLQTHGKPSNKSGRIQDFSGFLSVNSVNLQCGTATNDEKDEILSYLASGVII